MSQLTYEQLERIMPNTPPKKRAGALPIINTVMFDYEIINERRIAGFLATLAAESGELKYQEEIASGAAYENRKDLGNTQKGDGRRFKGRGRIQITGRSNYTSYTNYLKKNKHLPFVDFVAHPEMLAQEPYATDSAGWFWAIKVKNNAAADKGQFLTTQIRVNGQNEKTGLPNHWPVRERYWARGLSVLPDNFVLTGEPGQPVPTPIADDSKPLLKLGSRGDAVIELQQILNLPPDGTFGAHVELAVRDFQSDHGLTVDGIVGPATWAELEKKQNSAPVVIPPSDQGEGQNIPPENQAAPSSSEPGTSEPPPPENPTVVEPEVHIEKIEPHTEPEKEVSGLSATWASVSAFVTTAGSGFVAFLGGIKTEMVLGLFGAAAIIGAIYVWKRFDFANREKQRQFDANEAEKARAHAMQLALVQTASSPDKTTVRIV